MKKRILYSSLLFSLVFFFTNTQIKAQTNGALAVTAPGTFSGNTTPGPPPGIYDNCSLRPLSTDAEYQVNIPISGSWTFETCGINTNYDTYLYLGTSLCSNNTGQNDDTNGCDTFTQSNRGSRIVVNICAGTYYATVEAFGSSVSGNYALDISGGNPALTGGSIGGTQTICINGDPAVLSSSSGGSGGLPGYTYQWQLQTNCSGGFSNISGATSASYNPPGGLVNTTCYRRRVTDICGTTAFSNTVTVTVDNVPPSAVCQNTTIQLNASGSGSIVPADIDGGSTDNCGIASLAASQTSFNCSNVGNNTVTLTVTDTKGNTATCNATVTVQDVTNPVISCSDVTVSATPGQCDASVTVPTPTTSDACGINALTNTLTGTSNASGTYPVGTTNGVWTVSDVNGNLANCSFVITVTDDEAPTVTCSTVPIVRPVDATNCGATITMTTPAFADNCPGATITNSFNNTSNASGLYPPSITPLQWTVTDASGNTAGCLEFILVEDNVPPTSSCPADITQAPDPGGCEATISVPTPTFTDACGIVFTDNDFNGGLDASGSYPLGTTTVVWTAVDANANFGSCSTDITVSGGGTGVAISCPNDITVGTSSGQCDALVTYIAPSTTCPGVSISLQSGPTSGSTFSLGTTTVTYQATDGLGGTSTCSFDVIVIDNEAPSISCPGNLFQGVDAGNCSAAVTYTTPVGTDNCPGATTALTAGLASGAAFPVGSTTVTYTSTDAAGNSSTCSFLVTVSDDETPTITCPTDITSGTDAGSCDAVITWTAPAGTDNCPSPTTIQSGGPASGSAFIVGTTTITYRVTDAAGNTQTCTFDVTVSDDENPTVTCPPDATLSTSAGLCGAIYLYTSPTGSDNCTGSATALTGGLTSGSIFPLGTTTNTFTTTDGAGNTATCDFDITVEDNENPQIICPLPVNQSTDASSCDAAVSMGQPVVLDNCPGSTYSNSFNATTNGSGTYSLGTTTVTWTATDANGNTATCAIAVTITDDEDPAITCPTDIMQNTDAGSCDAVVNYTAPVGTDNCTGMSTALTDGLGSGGTFPLGSTTEEYTVTDGSGNTAVCTFTVTINDNENPAITCPTNISQGVDAGVCGAVITYTTPVGTDNCTGVTTAQTTGDGSGATFDVGTTTETYVVTDGSGNTASCSFTITITDDENPAITCPADITRNSNLGICGAVIVYGEPSGTDNCPGQTTVRTSGLGSGLTFPVGTSTELYTVTDAAGNTATCDFDVTVLDVENPIIFCPASTTVNTDAGSCDAAVTIAAATISDNCPGSTVVNDFNSTSDASDTYPLGSTTVEFTVTDAATNTATCTMIVIVRDTEDPAITCPTDITQNTDAGVCTAVVTYTAPTGTDNCSGVTTALTDGLGSGGSFALGMNTEEYTTTDAAGNVASCTFTITIEDNELPTITCPVDMTVTADADCEAVLAYTAPVGADNCMGATTALTSGLGTGATLTGATTVEEYTVTDGSGNSASCSFTITLEDDTPPSITCPSNSTLYAGGACTALTPDYLGGTNLLLSTPLDYGTTQGQNNILYGYYFAFDFANASLLNYNSGTSRWEGPQSFATPFLDANGGHPGVDDLAWAVRRVTSQTAGTVIISGEYFDRDLNCGDGAHVRIFHNGVEIFTALNISGTLTTYSFTRSVQVGDLIDFVIDPIFDAGCDDTQFTGRISTSTGLTFSDNCSSPVITQDPAPGTILPLGSSFITLTATDAAGNTSACAFTVSVLDSVTPVLTCPADVLTNTDAGTCDAALTVASPTVNENCSMQVLLNDFTGGTDANGTYPLGTTTVTWTGTDIAGNVGTCAMDVTVNDGEIPTITCPSDATQNTDPGVCDAAFTIAAPATADNCGVASVVNDYNSTSDASDTYPLGTTTVTYTITDNAGNSDNCSFDLTVVDAEAPVITCPATITQDSDPGNCDAAVMVPVPTASDNCSLNPISNNINGTSDASGTYPVGVTTVVFLVTDGAGAAAGCNVDIVIVDNEAPALTCPTDITQSADVGSCNGTVTVPAPTNSDNCGVNSLDNDFNNTSDASDVYPLGTTTVVWTVDDVNGNVSTCSMDITITNNTPPALTCPNDTSVSAAAGMCSENITIAVPAASASCGLNSVVNDYNGMMDASGSYNVGVTTVTWTAEDAVGNTNSCAITVTVTDDENPMITCPGNISQPAGLSTCNATIVVPVITPTDNCDVASLTNDFTNTSNASGIYPVGTTTVTYTVDDVNGNSTTCSFDVTVTEDQVPDIVCPADISQAADAGACDAAVMVPAPTTADNCGVQMVMNDFNSTSDASDTYAVGTTTVVWTVTDVNSNTSTCSMDITVTDMVAPVITCTTDITVNTDPGICGATVTVPAPTVTDDCPIVSITNSINGTSDASGTYTGGSSLVLWSAEDASGNVSTCQHFVIVEDDEDPLIFCPSDITQSADSGACDAAVVVPVPVTVDNCASSAPTNDFTGTGNASGTYPEGMTTVTWTVSDIFGNTNTCSFTVTITDDEAPAITCPAMITATTDAGSCDAAVAVPQPTVVLNCPGAVVIVNDFNGTSDADDTYPLGTTTVTWTVSDISANSASCSVDVMVTDGEAPTITCPADMTESTDAGICDAMVTVGAPTTADNCGVASVVNDINGTSDASGTYPLGATTINWTVTDNAGNTADCAMTVTIEDDEMPTIVCPTDITQGVDPGSCDATVASLPPTVGDNCMVGSVTNDFNSTSDSGDIYPQGTTTVTWTVMDMAGNMNTCTFDITIVDDQAPVMSCPADITAPTASGSCDAAVTVTAPTVTADCGATVATNDFNGTSDASDTYPEGSTTVVWTVADANGNTAACSVIITVMDDTDPTIACPADMTVSTDAGVATAAVTVGQPTTSDNCGVASYTNDWNNTTDASGTYMLGTTDVTWSCLDNSGNMASCLLRVTVEDTEDPTITCPPMATRNATFAACDAPVFVDPPVTGDNHMVASIVNDRNGTDDASDIYAVGSHNVRWTVTDMAGNTTTCDMTVEVYDIELPSVSCPSDISQLTDPGSCVATVSTMGTPSGADNCSIASFTNDFNSTTDGNDAYPVGATTVVWTANDASGNTATCEITVTVTDTEPPTVVCPSDITQASDPGACQASVVVPDPTSAGNCGISNLTNDFNNTSNASGVYTGGLTMVTFTASDDNGNSASCSFTVTISDNNPPVATCPGIVLENTDAGGCDAQVTVPGPTATDDCATTMATNDFNNSSDASDLYPVGNTVVTWTISDATGNTASCSTNVNVVDNEAPTIVCPASVSSTTGTGVCKNLALPIATPSTGDNCSIASVINSRNGTSDASGSYSVGVTTIVWTVTDQSGNTATCDMTATVVDQEAPSIICPSDLTQSAPIGACDAPVAVPIPIRSDACGIANIVNDYTGTSDASGTYLVGVTNVLWTVTDVNGNTASCDMNISVTGDPSQQLSCPPDVTQSADPGSCNALVTVAPFSIGDSCGIIGLTNDFNNSSDATGLYSVGTTVVTWTVIDQGGGVTNCAMNVTVTDGNAPAITCPGDIVRPTDAGSCDANITVPAPNTSDGCGIASVTNDYTATSDASGLYPEGPTVVTWTASDAQGNSATCSMFVLVSDITPPTVTCPSDITQGNDFGTCDAEVTVPMPTVSDNCAVAFVSNNVTGTLDASDVYPLGTTTVTWTALDGDGNVASCSIDITIEDATPPVLVNCPTDINVNNDAGQCGAVVSWMDPEPDDECVTVNITSTHTSGSSFPIGTTAVTYTLVDPSANTSTCGFNVTVTDNEGPAITCPADVNQAVDAGQCSANVTVSAPTVTENCSGAVVLNDFNNTSDANGTYPVGATTVVWSVTDQAGASASCSMLVTVNDDELPAITCPADLTRTVGPAACDVSVLVPAPAATDNCSIASVMNDFNNTTDASDTYPIGTTAVTLTASDASGNTADCVFNITVEDNISPSISACPANISSGTDAGQCGAAVTWSPPTASDNCATSLSFTSTHNSGDNFPVGTTTVVYTAEDQATNQVTCAFDVVVTDSEGPTIPSCPSDVNLTLATACDATVAISPLSSSVSDNCGVQSVVNDFNGTTDASGTYPEGSTVVTWTVMDISGNTSTCSHTVNLLDIDPPSVTCPVDITENAPVGQCDANILMLVPGAGDNCSANVMLSNDYNNTANASDIYPVGTTTVTWTATDNSGNTGTCSFNVVVEGPMSVDAGPDQVSCASGTSDLLVTVTDGSGNYTFEWSDGSSIVGTTAAISVSPSISTTYSVTVTDQNGGCAAVDMVVVTVTGGSESNCATADVIASLPYATGTITTECAGNNYNNGDACGDIHMDGEDYVLTYTPSTTESIDLSITGVDPTSEASIFVLDGCPDAGGTSCIASGFGSTGVTIDDLTLEAGTQYYIIVSSLATPGSTPFALTVDESACGRDVFEVNDVLAQAKQLPEIGVRKNARICPANDIDWFYHIVDDVNSEVIIKLSDLSINCDLQVLYNGQSNTATSATAGTSDEVITLSSLAPGDVIYIRVTGETGVASSDGYQLDVYERATPFGITPKDAPGKDVSGLGSQEEEQLIVDESVNFAVYPNPAKDVVYIRTEGLDNGMSSFVLYNATGQAVIRETWSVERTPVKSLDLSALPEGVYYYKVVNGTHSTSGEIIHMDW